MSGCRWNLLVQILEYDRDQIRTRIRGGIKGIFTFD
ncbi:hypothetical protein SAMN05216191_101322, partial [Paenibacillus jilunlii]